MRRWVLHAHNDLRSYRYAQLLGNCLDTGAVRLLPRQDTWDDGLESNSPLLFQALHVTGARRLRHGVQRVVLHFNNRCTLLRRELRALPTLVMMHDLQPRQLAGDHRRAHHQHGTPK